MHPVSAAALAIPVNRDYTGIVSLRPAGDMRQPGPLRGLLGQVGIAPDRLRRVRQVHSRRVVTDAECRRLAAPGRNIVHDLQAAQVAQARWAPHGADGLVAGPGSAAAGVTLMVTVADCVPILLVAPTGAYALLHSGWRGTGIAAAAVQCLQQRFDAAPASLRVVLGPAIGACCYRVDDARYQLFRNAYGSDTVREGCGDTGSHTGRYLDLHAANTVVLRRLGVRDIRAVAECTSCSPRLYSSRRDGGGARCRLMAVLLVPGAR